VNLVNFSILASQDAGISIDEESAEVDPPARISIANGTIRGVSNTGHATSPGTPLCGVDIFSNQAGNNIGDISIENVHIVGPDGAGVCSRPSFVLAGTLSVSNSHVDNAGAGTDPTLEGSCFHILGFSSFIGTGNDCNGAKGVGYYVDGSSVGMVSITGGRVHNVNTLQAAGSAIWMHNTQSYNVGGVNISDDRLTATSFNLHADGTVRSGIFHDIDFNIADVTHPLIISAGSRNDIFKNITPSLALENIIGLPGNSTSVYCSDCDTPPSPGAACTAAGDHAGAALSFMRNVPKCY
jgi:hypothetical protein